MPFPFGKEVKERTAETGRPYSPWAQIWGGGGGRGLGCDYLSTFTLSNGKGTLSAIFEQHIEMRPNITLSSTKTLKETSTLETN